MTAAESESYGDGIGAFGRRKEEGRHPMYDTPQQSDRRRFRLAANDNEMIVDEADVEGHALTRNDNETIVEDEPDVEAHSLTRNDNETVVEDDDTDGHRLAANDTEIAIEDTDDTEGHRLAANDNEITLKPSR